eukprot:5384844-Prymnesium_polylepis.1
MRCADRNDPTPLIMRHPPRIRLRGIWVDAANRRGEWMLTGKSASSDELAACVVHPCSLARGR